MILVIDNYDSFTYNLVQYLGEIGEEVLVRRNDEISIDEVKRLKPEAIIISPGPCGPQEAGISIELVRNFYSLIPILGVCLGHQVIGYAFGAVVRRAESIMHGKTSLIFHDGKALYRGLPNPFEAARYHSLIVHRRSLPDSLEISAWTKEGEIMGLRHKRYRVEGVQFHPESILTSSGPLMIKNFISLVRKEGG